MSVIGSPISFTLLVSIVCLSTWLDVRHVAAADKSEFKDLKLLRQLPESETELAAAHRSAGGGVCEQIPAGQSLEQTSFSLMPVGRDPKNARSMLRQSVLSVGLSMDSVAKAELPMASRSRILDYLNAHYLSIQVRVRRDSLDRKLYFDHRPMAATARFSGSRVTEPFQPTVTNAVREFRSIGLFTRGLDASQAEDFRTLVFVFRNDFIRPGGATVEQHEFAFVRGRDDGVSDQLNVHVFVTSEGRTQLNYLNEYHRPQSPANCSIRGSIVITEFGGIGNLEPRDSATRSYRLDTRRIFPMTNIEAYCEKKSLKGGFAENVDTVLDVLIDQMNPTK